MKITTKLHAACLFLWGIFTFERSHWAHWCICPILSRAKKFRRGKIGGVFYSQPFTNRCFPFLIIAECNAEQSLRSFARVKNTRSFTATSWHRCVDISVPFYFLRILKQWVCCWFLNGFPPVCETHEVFRPKVSLRPPVRCTFTHCWIC